MTTAPFPAVRVAELRRLLLSAGDDPLLGPQLRDRLAEAERDLVTLPPSATSPVRAAVFFRGPAVSGSEGIRPSLAGEALIQFEKMFSEQALHDERKVAREQGFSRRPRKSPQPTLLFTSTPRGSFGLEFTPVLPDEPSLRELHERSLLGVAEQLADAALGDSGRPAAGIESVPPAVLKPMKQFLKALSQNGADLRLVVGGRRWQRFTAEQVKEAFERLNKEVSQEEVTYPGTFQGVTLKTGVFDFLKGDVALITGTASDELSEDDLLRIHALTNTQCLVTLQMTTVRTPASLPKITYTLLDATPITTAPADGAN